MYLRENRMEIPQLKERLLGASNLDTSQFLSLSGNKVTIIGNKPFQTNKNKISSMLESIGINFHLFNFII